MGTGDILTSLICHQIMLVWVSVCLLWMSPQSKSDVVWDRILDRSQNFRSSPNKGKTDWESPLIVVDSTIQVPPGHSLIQPTALRSISMAIHSGKFEDIHCQEFCELDLVLEMLSEIGLMSPLCNPESDRKYWGNPRASVCVWLDRCFTQRFTIPSS